MDKIDRLIDSLKKSNFKKAAEMEAEIIEEQCKDSGICRNFLVCRIVNNSDVKNSIEREKKRPDVCPDCNVQIYSFNRHDPIKFGMSDPNTFTNVGAIGYYKCIEKEIVQKVNQFTDQSFLSILDKKCGAPLILQENRITVDVFIGQITKILSSGYILYGVMWNLRDWCTLMSDSSWNQYQKLDKRYGDIGWQPDLRGINIRNFISPLVPEGEIYITALSTNSLKSLGNATIYTNISINLSYQSANKPLTLTVDCSIDMVLNDQISIVKIIKKQ